MGKAGLATAGEAGGRGLARKRRQGKYKGGNLKDRKVIAELKRIAEKHKGLLKPETIVKEAEAKDSPLHDQFTWDNDEAAEKYRIWEARHLLNICVEMIGTEEDQREMRVFVSLREDREDGGYRLLDRVVSSRTLSAQLLEDAFEEMNHFKHKYRDIKELTGVFAAMDEVLVRK